jgi:hypothetical protein
VMPRLRKRPVGILQPTLVTFSSVSRSAATQGSSQRRSPNTDVPAELLIKIISLRNLQFCRAACLTTDLIRIRTCSNPVDSRSLLNTGKETTVRLERIPCQFTAITSINDIFHQRKGHP